MKFTTSKGGETLAEMTHRIFEIKGTGAKARTKEAEAALLAANPHLANVEEIPAGTAVVVPPVAGARARVAEVHALGSESIRQVRSRLGGLRQALDDAVKAEVGKLKESLKNVERLRDQPKAPLKRLAQIEGGAKARLAELAKLTSSQQDGIDRLDRDLEAFLESFS